MPAARLLDQAAATLRQLGRAPVSWLWFGVVMAIQALVSHAGGPERVGGWFLTFGLSRVGILSGGYWQLGSYALLHGNWLHAGFNGLFVLLMGSRIEHMAGHRTMLQATVAGVLAGGVFHLLLGAGLLAGLSGGCMALLLLATTLSPQSRMMPLPVSGRSLGLGLILAALILTLINPDLDLPGASDVGRWLSGHGMSGWFRIGHACHLGGGLAGWLYGRWMLRPPPTLEHLQRARARREARGAVSDFRGDL